MSDIKQKFKIESPDGLFEITIGNLIENTIEIVTNFKREDKPLFFHVLVRHPYLVPIGTFKNQFSTELMVKDNFDFEIFHEDLQTIMEVYLYENTETMAPTIGTAN